MRLFSLIQDSFRWWGLEPIIFPMCTVAPSVIPLCTHSPSPRLAGRTQLWSDACTGHISAQWNHLIEYKTLFHFLAQGKEFLECLQMGLGSFEVSCPLNLMFLEVVKKDKKMFVLKEMQMNFLYSILQCLYCIAPLTSITVLSPVTENMRPVKRSLMSDRGNYAALVKILIN